MAGLPPNVRVSAEGAEIIVSSSQMEMVVSVPESRSDASLNLAAPSSVKSKRTTYCPTSFWEGSTEALTTSLLVKITVSLVTPEGRLFSSRCEPSRKVSWAVSPNSATVDERSSSIPSITSAG